MTCFDAVHFVDPSRSVVLCSSVGSEVAPVLNLPQCVPDISLVERLEHLNSDYQLLPKQFVDDTRMSQELSKLVRNPSILDTKFCDLLGLQLCHNMSQLLGLRPSYFDGGLG